MNFTTEMLALVLAGKKTQTRRPVKANERENRWHLGGDTDETINEVIQGKRLKWLAGREYAVCPGRGKKAVARMQLLSIRRERAIDISEADAIAEGFESREAFWDKLRSLYGKNVDLTAAYWVLEFVIVEGGAA